MRTALAVIATALALGGGSSLAASAWSWFAPVARGSSSGKLGEIQAPTVKLDGFSDVWPGETITVKGTVSNPNSRSVTLTKVALDGVEADAGCGKGAWDDTSSGAVLKPGDNELTLGTWTVGKIPVSCSGAKLKIDLTLRSAFGVES